MDTETKNKIAKLEQQVAELISKLDVLKRDYSIHQHSDFDGTKTLTKSISVDKGEHIRNGLSDSMTQPVTFIGTTAEQIVHSMSVGLNTKNGLFNKDDCLQINYIHQPNNTSKQSFITAFRKPLVSSLPNQTVATTSGGNTITINGFNFGTNELAGALISIYNSSSSLVETRVISSNTSNVITISGTWGASTSNALFLVYVPVFLGSADTIWQRFYAQEGINGGVRFGMGVTGGALNQNGLLYMDATGDLYWRNKSGTSTKLN